MRGDVVAVEKQAILFEQLFENGLRVFLEAHLLVLSYDFKTDFSLLLTELGNQAVYELIKWESLQFYNHFLV